MVLCWLLANRGLCDRVRVCREDTPNPLCLGMTSILPGSLLLEKEEKRRCGYFLVSM